jgi:fructose-1,6-bisphosphatase I
VLELSSSGGCAAIVSEELTEPLRLAQTGIITFLDPLDGSANLDAHGLSGSIFGLAPVTSSVDTDLLAPGRRLSWAGYVLYSSATVMVLANRERADVLVWDPARAGFVIAQERLRCPEQGELYSLNEARVPDWSKPARAWLGELKRTRKPGGAALYSQRYAGALVADAHRVLLEGGVFAYPGDKQNPNGKLRLQYEVNPISFVFEAAGGAATLGRDNPLDYRPTRWHERAPLVVGSRREVEAYESHMSRHRPSFAPAA